MDRLRLNGNEESEPHVICIRRVLLRTRLWYCRFRRTFALRVLPLKMPAHMPPACHGYTNKDNGAEYQNRVQDQHCRLE